MDNCNTTPKPTTKRKPANPRGRVPGVNAALDNRATLAEVEDMPYTLRKREVARILGMHADTILKLARKGEIPGRLIGGEWVFSTKQILALVEGAV